MEEIIRRCDMPVKSRGVTAPHGEQVLGEPLQFVVGLTAYQIDLCEAHRAEFDKAVAPFMEAATPVSINQAANRQAVRKALKGKKGGFTTKEVRKWLAEQGRDVAPSGRLPNEAFEEFRQAHSA